VLIADDHVMVRHGLRLLIEEADGFRVVGEAGSVPEAERLTCVVRPSALLLDLTMPGGSTLAAIPRLRAAAPATAIVVLTMHDDPGLAREALQAGAVGFVLKEAADEELLEALSVAVRGQPWLDPRLTERMAAGEPEPPNPDGLSNRERCVLRLLALGYTNSEVAEQLSRSIRTVETHRAHIQHKLKRTSRSELVHYAFEHGVVAEYMNEAPRSASVS
jgi:two-component system response regulator NreC